MAEVVAAHSNAGVDPETWARWGAPIRWACLSCGAVEDVASSEQQTELTKSEWHGMHIAAKLAEAGYGDVPGVPDALMAAAKSALLAAADDMPIETLAGADGAAVWLRTRARGIPERLQG